MRDAHHRGVFKAALFGTEHIESPSLLHGLFTSHVQDGTAYGKASSGKINAHFVQEAECYLPNTGYKNRGGGYTGRGILETYTQNEGAQTENTSRTPLKLLLGQHFVCKRRDHRCSHTPVMSREDSAWGKACAARFSRSNATDSATITTSRKAVAGVQLHTKPKRKNTTKTVRTLSRCR